MSNSTGNGLQSIGELISAQKPGYSLDQRFYTDPAIYELELERIIYRNWLIVGHQSELPNVGDYKVFTAGHESAIVVRGVDREIRAFANVCRHRGSRVCLEQKGNAGKFTCPYHGWMYDIDGSLRAARDMPSEFDSAAHGLKPLSFDLIQGLMLVSFSSAPPSTENCKADLREVLAMFDFENLKIAANKKYAIPANWKLSLENYQECYHCATAHPEYARMHTLMLDDKKRERVQSHMKDQLRACGIVDTYIDRIDTSTRPEHIGYSYSRTALFEGYSTGSKDGEPVAPLLGQLKGYDGGASDISLGPCSYLLAYSDHVVCFVFTTG